MTITTTDEPPLQSVADGRRRIDDVDAALRALIGQRLELSRQIQALRLAEGGPRIEHRRENEVTAQWADELGPAGAEIAHALLTLCRGSLARR